MKQRYIKIHPQDKVAVALEPLSKGTECSFDDACIVLREDIPQGHKFALTDLAEGEQVIKYGLPIGIAREKILTGSSKVQGGCPTP